MDLEKERRDEEGGLEIGLKEWSSDLNEGL